MFSRFQHNPVEAERLMNYETQAVTLDLKLCRACGLELLASHRFCRLCGASQSHLEFVTKRHDCDLSQSLNANINMLAPDSERKAFSPAGYRSISGSVLNSFVTTEMTAATSRIKSRAKKKAVAAVIAIPLWLMIVLLSPLDALEASWQVTKQL
jgi:hypothetical protein